MSAGPSRATADGQAWSFHAPQGSCSKCSHCVCAWSGPGSTACNEAAARTAQTPDAQLPGTCLPAAQLSDAHLSETQLPASQLPEAQLTESQLPGTQLPEACRLSRDNGSLFCWSAGS